MRALRPRRWHLTKATALALATVFAAAGAALAAGCGGNDSGDKLSKARAASLQVTLNRVEQDVSAGDCTSADQQAGTLRGQIGSLRRVSRELRSALKSSAARLQSLVEEQCKASAPPVVPQPETGATGNAEPKEKGKKKGHPKKEKGNKDEGPPNEQPVPDQQGGGGTGGSGGETNLGGGNQP
jgi:hypothetical protein